MQSQRCDADHAASLIHHPVNRKHTMDLNILFENIGSIATSLERIADSLERRAETPQSTIHVSATSVTEEKPKRTRRTKAEIEAEKGLALESGEFVPAAEIPAPQFVAPVVAAPVVVAPVVAAPVVAAPAAPAAPVVADPYLNYAVEHQFAELNKLAAPYFSTYPSVKDAVVGEAAKHGLGVPFSDASDRSQPGANYRAVSNEVRFAIYDAAVKSIAALGNGI